MKIYGYKVKEKRTNKILQINNLIIKKNRKKWLINIFGEGYIL